MRSHDLGSNDACTDKFVGVSQHPCFLYVCLDLWAVLSKTKTYRATVLLVQNQQNAVHTYNHTRSSTVVWVNGTMC